MTWDQHHSASEKLAAEASIALTLGEWARAETLYRDAARQEEAALNELGSDKTRTRGITAVSGVALWYKGKDYAEAERMAHKCLAESQLPSFATAQLRNLLHAIWSSQAASETGVQFVPGDVLISVKGGGVVHGGAPLELIVQRVETVETALFRTVEMLLGRSFRRRGAPPIEIQSQFRPWLFQAPAGSYQFAVRMQEPKQTELFGDKPDIQRVTTTFFNVLRATATDPDNELPLIVPDKDYRSAFLSLSRDLAPSGKTFARLEVSDASAPTEPVVSFAAETRRELNAAIRKSKPPLTLADEPEVVTGILRGLHLEKDWLEVVRAGESTIHIEGAGDVVDDIVGPMVNRRVIIQATRRGNRYFYRDIELEE